MHAHAETVVLLSGLWLPPWSLTLLKRRLTVCGFEVRVIHYRSVRANLAENAHALQAQLAAIPADTVHFVGYSLGGVLIRALFEHHPRQRPGRIVTLATPHLGSQAASRLVRSHWGRRLLGRSVGDIVEGATCTWTPPARDFGSLAGTGGLGLGRWVARLPAPHDGTVALVETQLPGATDTVALPVSHASMLFSGAVARQICHFLKTGRFSR
jgi:pimeloyl-ACP methyl ester carboxylesterase